MVINFAVHTQHIAGHNFPSDLVVHKHFNDPIHYLLMPLILFLIPYMVSLLP